MMEILRGTNVRGGSHNPKVVGSNPTPATSRFKEQNSDHRVRSALSICGVSGLFYIQVNFQRLLHLGKIL